MASDEPKVVFCDAVQTLGVHNGVVRVSLIRLGPDGRPTPAIELLLPVPQLQTLIRALQQVKV
jgi:hypothetical protein